MAENKKDFPFPESLLKLLYLDIWALEPATKRIEKARLNLIPVERGAVWSLRKQIVTLFDRALSLDSDRKKSVSEKMVAYYNAEGNDYLNDFYDSHCRTA